MKSMATVFFILFLVFLSFPANTQAAGMENHMDGMMGGMMGKEAGKKAVSNSYGITQEAEAASVTIKVTYRNPFDKAAPVFKIVFDTHSVSLDEYKFEDVSILRFNGSTYRASLVSSEGSGHHREAEVEFKGADAAMSGYLELVIKGVAGVEERVFRFEPGVRPVK